VEAAQQRENVAHIEAGKAPASGRLSSVGDMRRARRDQ